MVFQRGFTLIEVLVVIAIIGTMTSLMVSQFSRSRVDFAQAVNGVIADVRDAQTRALSGYQFEGAYRCGYGIHFTSPTQYLLYAGADAQVVDCTADDRNYDSGVVDEIVLVKTLDGALFDFGEPLAPDIFFEPPDPTTFINNASGSAVVPARIILHRAGSNCGSDASQCKSVCVYGSGRIEDASSWLSCP